MHSCKLSRGFDCDSFLPDGSTPFPMRDHYNNCCLPCWKHYPIQIHRITDPRYVGQHHQPRTPPTTHHTHTTPPPQSPGTFLQE